VPETATTDTEAARRQLLARFPVFAELPVEELRRLLGEAQLLRAPAGSVLFDAKQPCRGFPLLLEGSVRVAKTSPNGREIQLYRVEPGQGCILSGSCLLGQTDYSATAMADQDTVLISVPPALFHELMLDLGSVREIVSRLLRSFEDRGWVKLERERVTLLDPKSMIELTAART
jgi:CRP/FNR family transcriptional regulator